MENRYKVTVDDQEFTFSKEEVSELDMVQTSENSYHLLQDQASKQITVTTNKRNPKKITVAIDGSSYQLTIKDETDQLIDDLGFNASSQIQLENVKAPMPGLVLEILVKEGDTVAAGESLLILEAMKMENLLKSPGDLTVKKINVEVGDSVDKGQVLIEIE